MALRRQGKRGKSWTRGPGDRFPKVLAVCVSMCRCRGAREASVRGSPTRGRGWSGGSDRPLMDVEGIAGWVEVKMDKVDRRAARSLRTCRFGSFVGLRAAWADY
ncbi:hypothetical protein EJ04DRAFT_365586 [Polyplosphaeria fusca]|uniref:Uncharacterized protein n=1 Tax=Polyplosphaeria fusca TaxID=682080 RepID=A0A9P4QV13_9PLEO|nr:hypothetical protein EJ04DRAFT_365586 [Polyplosphaeria fusca]